jgi:hypothetical protein
VSRKVELVFAAFFVWFVFGWLTPCRTVPALVTPIWVRRPSAAASRTVPRFSRAADAPG